MYEKGALDLSRFYSVHTTYIIIQVNIRTNYKISKYVIGPDVDHPPIFGLVHGILLHVSIYTNIYEYIRN